MPLTDYLASEPKLVTVRESTWAAIVDEEEAQKKPIGNQLNIFFFRNSSLSSGEYEWFTNRSSFSGRC